MIILPRSRLIVVGVWHTTIWLAFVSPDGVIHVAGICGALTPEADPLVRFMAALAVRIN